MMLVYVDRDSYLCYRLLRIDKLRVDDESSAYRWYKEQAIEVSDELFARYEKCETEHEEVQELLMGLYDA